MILMEAGDEPSFAFFVGAEKTPDNTLSFEMGFIPSGLPPNLKLVDYHSDDVYWVELPLQYRAQHNSLKVLHNELKILKIN